VETNNHKKWGVIRKAKRVGKINNIFMKTNFFDSNSYFIDEKVNFFKLENCYQIYNEKGENIGTIAQKLSLGNKILRLLLNKTMLPFHLEIKNSDNDVEASISRGWSFFMSKITVKNAQGNTIGTIKQKFTLFKPTFKIFDSSDVLIAEISGDWSAWNFTIADASNNQIGTISKKWAGAMKEIFTSADKYNVHIESGYSNIEHKIAILSSAITIDMVLKESK
jgi:uncharacterized protein YxjI